MRRRPPHLLACAVRFVVAVVVGSFEWSMAAWPAFANVVVVDHLTAAVAAVGEDECAAEPVVVAVAAFAAFVVASSFVAAASSAVALVVAVALVTSAGVVAVAVEAAWASFLPTCALSVRCWKPLWLLAFQRIPMQIESISQYTIENIRFNYFSSFVRKVF